MHVDPPAERHNIVLFGATGAGKSSIVNMLRGIDEAPVSPKVTGCTLSSTSYKGTIRDQCYTFWDTAGLNETDVGKVPDMRAVAELYRLLQKLEGGVSLLVFCMQKPKSTWVAARQNWDLFKHIICQNQVPAVVAITHLEQEEDVDAWWAENNWVFAEHGVIPSSDIHRDYEGAAPWVEEANEQAEQARPKVRGVACITASRGRRLRGGGHMLQEQYDESIWKVKKLVYESHLAKPWKVEEVSWFQETTRQVKTGHWLCPQYVEEKGEAPGQGAYSLMERWGLTYEAARVVIGAIKASVTGE